MSLLKRFDIDRFLMSADYLDKGPTLELLSDQQFLQAGVAIAAREPYPQAPPPKLAQVTESAASCM